MEEPSTEVTVDWRWKSVKRQRAATYGSFVLSFVLLATLGIGTKFWASCLGVAWGGLVMGPFMLYEAESENGLVWPTKTILRKLRWTVLVNLLLFPVAVFIYSKMGVPWWRSALAMPVIYIGSLPYSVTVDMARRARKQQRNSQGPPIVRIGN